MARQTAIQTTNANQIQVSSPAEMAAAEPNENWSYSPPIDVLEWPTEYTIACDAPGLNADQIDLTYERGVVHLHGSVRPRYPQNAQVLRQEYGVGDFDRDIPLGRLAEFVDGDRISATYEQGVLTIHLPKFASAEPKRVQIQMR